MTKPTPTPPKPILAPEDDFDINKYTCAFCKSQKFINKVHDDLRHYFCVECFERLIKQLAAIKEKKVLL